jgi:N utilization substance protein A
VKALVLEVREEGKGAPIVVSRSHPDFIKALFELEVPELLEGVVEIKAIAREPGHRTKLAVYSNDPSVDPVGACVGARGSRVRQVVNELRGEKVDLVQYREDQKQFIAEALSPVRGVREVKIDEDEKEAIVIVPDGQLSLAIGKEGQNARLAARLTGFRIDIRPESNPEGLPIEAPAEGLDGSELAATPTEGTEPAAVAAASDVESAAEPVVPELEDDVAEESAEAEPPSAAADAQVDADAVADDAGDDAQEAGVRG